MYDKVIKLIQDIMRDSARLVRLLVPLPVRMRLAQWTMGHGLRGQHIISMEMLRDLRDADPNAFHRFLWSNHLAYASTYQVARRFGAEQIEPTRHALFSEIDAALHVMGLNPSTDVRSVFDVGCSSGYLLRYAETKFYPAATTLKGVDIDRYAVNAGNAYLRSQGSRVSLTLADMTEANHVMGDETYDLIVCCGVLMYLDESQAAKVVKTMLAHARWLIGIICLAHPLLDNSMLEHSGVREADGAFIHNVSRMLRDADATVLSSWRSTNLASPAYSIIARPRDCEPRNSHMSHVEVADISACAYQGNDRSGSGGRPREHGRTGVWRSQF